MLSTFKLPDNHLRIVICSIAHRVQTFAKVVKYNTSRNQTVFLSHSGCAARSLVAQNGVTAGNIIAVLSRKNQWKVFNCHVKMK